MFVLSIQVADHGSAHAGPAGAQGGRELRGLDFRPAELPAGDSRDGDADDHVVELQALLLQLVLNVDVTAAAAL